jgi:hypothetical protein
VRRRWPIVDVKSESIMLGGAANALNNIISLVGEHGLFASRSSIPPGTTAVISASGMASFSARSIGVIIRTSPICLSFTTRTLFAFSGLTLPISYFLSFSSISRSFEYFEKT